MHEHFISSHVIDDKLMDLSVETKNKLIGMKRTMPKAPITLRQQGKLEMLEEIEWIIEQLKEN